MHRMKKVNSHQNNLPSFLLLSFIFLAIVHTRANEPCQHEVKRCDTVSLSMSVSVKQKRERERERIEGEKEVAV